ncbi:MAG: hypothetical protein ACRC41_14965 [Sarcina sp.]
MNIYLVCTRGDYLNNQIVICKKLEDIIKLAFNGDKENFLKYALITHLNNVDNNDKSPMIFNIDKDSVINSEEILLQRLKANGVKKISDYVKENIEKIYFDLNFRINLDKQYLEHPIEYQQEVKEVINAFKGYNIT